MKTGGTRFYDQIVHHLEGYIMVAERSHKWKAEMAEGLPAYKEYLRRLRHPECRRILFDTRQAALFDELDESPPPNIQRGIRAPFDMFYLEFTEPLLLKAQEPGQHDLARALLYTVVPEDVLKVRFGGQEYKVENCIMFLTNEMDPERWQQAARRDVEAAGKLIRDYLLAFDNQDLQYVDRSWTLRLQEGLALVKVENARREDSEIPDDWDDEAYIPSGYQIPGFQGERRRIGWWEETAQSYTDLLSWICAYTMAKTVHVVTEPWSRQVRRWHERKNRPLPKPWHGVRVEPKFSNGRPTAQHEGSAHRYRYDVIGHLRFGRHPRKDGTYNEIIEWVPPHQRGLDNEIYIPKTYKVERGKAVSPLMRRYYGIAEPAARPGRSQ